MSDPLSVHQLEPGKVWVDGRLVAQVIEASDASLLVDELFLRKFGDHCPPYPRHFVALYNHQSNVRVLGYTHFLRHESYFLLGGSCVDDRVVRLMSPAERAALRLHDSVSSFIVQFAFRQLETQCDAIFAYSGNPQAVTKGAHNGLEPTQVPRLLARWGASIPASRRTQIAIEIKSLGPF